MVFFSCEGCNETLKKAQVENHLRRCHCPVSCVDCSQVFPGVSYQQVRAWDVDVSGRGWTERFDRWIGAITCLTDWLID